MYYLFLTVHFNMYIMEMMAVGSEVTRQSCRCQSWLINSSRTYRLTKATLLNGSIHLKKKYFFFFFSLVPRNRKKTCPRTSGKKFATAYSSPSPAARKRERPRGNNYKRIRLSSAVRGLSSRLDKHCLCAPVIFVARENSIDRAVG